MRANQMRAIIVLPVPVPLLSNGETFSVPLAQQRLCQESLLETETVLRSKENEVPEAMPVLRSCCILDAVWGSRSRQRLKLVILQ